MFIEKVSGESKSTYKQGMIFESESSAKLHPKGIPVLVSEHLLRKRGLGQIDLAILRENQLEVYEFKKSTRSTLDRVHRKQRLRLEKSCLFLGALFKKKVTLTLYSGIREKLGNWFLS